MLVCHIHFGQFPFHSTPIPYELTKNLYFRGVDSHVIALSYHLEEKLEENYNGVRVTRIPVEIKRPKYLALEKFSSQVNFILSESNFDLIHIYAFRGSSYIRKRSNNNNKWLYHLITGNISRGLKSSIGNHITKFESNFFDKIVVNTRNVGKWVLGSTSFDEIPPGVDYNRFRPKTNEKLREKLGFNREDIVVIYSGSLSRFRKLDILLEGFKFAVQKCNHLKLLILGPGEKDYVIRLSTDLQISDHVKIVGYVPYLSVHEYISISDIGLAYVPITPEYNPQPALKTLEMLSCGKPVVATATEGNANFIVDGKNGILVNDHPQTISRGLLKLIDDEQLMKKISRSARKSIIKYDWASIVSNQLLPIYNQMIVE